jgi:hypothetical protein
MALYFGPFPPWSYFSFGRQKRSKSQGDLRSARKQVRAAMNSAEPLRRLINRRRFVQGLAVCAGVATLDLEKIQASGQAKAQSLPVLSGDHFDLVINSMPVNFTGRRSVATAVNGSVPGPILRWREGDTVTLAATNRLRVAASIHWHAIRLPSGMDGAPGLSFPGIAPNETFVYRIPVVQHGTYWYHSHSRFQECAHSGPDPSRVARNLDIVSKWRVCYLG